MRNLLTIHAQRLDLCPILSLQVSQNLQWSSWTFVSWISTIIPQWSWMLLYVSKWTRRPQWLQCCSHSLHMTLTSETPIRESLSRAFWVMAFWQWTRILGLCHWVKAWIMQPNKGIDGFYLVRQRSSKAPASKFLWQVLLLLCTECCFKGQWQRKFLLAISILLDDLTMKLLSFPSQTF